jgi:NAD(P)-dependent dehydrogenase (short-subunit alcohol dehydrogenase family)
MTAKLTGTVALVTGASSGIGAATARQLADHGAAVALVARRRDRLEVLAGEIDQAGGTALVVDADITDRTQAEAAVQQTVERLGRLDTLVNNAGLMLLGSVVGADTRGVGPHDRHQRPGPALHRPRRPPAPLLQAAQEGPRRVADIVNISSIAGRVAWNGYGVYITRPRHTAIGELWIMPTDQV